MKSLVKLIAPLALIVSIAPVALAQGGMGGGMPPEMAAKIKLWQKFGENHKNFTILQKTMFGFGECEKDPKAALTKDQAKNILSQLKKWEDKPVMSNDEAGALVKALTKGMTIPQIKTANSAKMPDMRKQMASRPGGMANFKMPDPKEYNPLNPSTMPFETARPMMKKSLDEFKAKLTAKLK